VPLLTTEESVPWPVDPRPRLNAFRGAVAFLLYNFRFVRLPLLLVALVLVAVSALRYASRAEEEQALAREARAVCR
jgi:hypothetical protein